MFIKKFIIVIGVIINLVILLCGGWIIYAIARKQGYKKGYQKAEDRTVNAFHNTFVRARNGEDTKIKDFINGNDNHQGDKINYHLASDREESIFYYDISFK